MRSSRWAAFLLLAFFCVACTSNSDLPNKQTAPEWKWGNSAQLFLESIPGETRPAEYIARHSSADRLMERWWALRESNDLADKRLRLEAIEFVIRYGALPLNDTLQPDYFALLEEFKVPVEMAAVTPETFELLKRDGLRGMTGEQMQAEFQKCVDILSKRPDDSGALTYLAAVCNIHATYENVDWELDYEKLLEICTTEYSRIRLCQILQARYQEKVRGARIENEADRAQAKKRDAVIENLVFEVLPYLSCDEERSAWVFSFYSRGVPRDDQLLKAEEYLTEHFPKSLEARYALASKLKLLAEQQGLEAAKQELSKLTERLALTADEIVDLQIVIANAIPLAADASEFVVRLMQTPLNRASHTKLVDVAFQLAAVQEDRDAMHKWADKRMAMLLPGEMLVRDEIATAIAQYYMSEHRWKDAELVWQIWQPEIGICGPQTETRYAQLAVCQLFQSKHDRALKTILEGMSDNNWTVLPDLLFQMYDRAFQLDDLKQIANRWEASPGRHREYLLAPQPDLNGQEGQLPLRREWGVRHLLKLRGLAEIGDFDSLVQICQDADKHSNGYFYPNNRTTEPRVAQETLESAKLLAAGGDESVRAIQRKFAQSKRSLSSWFLYCLLENKSPKAEQWLFELAAKYVAYYQPGGMSQPENAAVVQNFGELLYAIALTTRGETGLKRLLERKGTDLNLVRAVKDALDRKLRPVPTAPSWPPPPAGSLPHMLAVP